METFGLIVCLVAFIVIGVLALIMVFSMGKIFDKEIARLREQEDSKKQSNVVKE